MRIIAGEWRGRRLVSPAGATRPTAERVRESLFSMLLSRLGSFDGLRVADLYAGSGAFGLEALSRGAAFACFVESDAEALAAIRANLDSLDARERAELLAGSALSLPHRQPFDVLLADPPYAQRSGSAALRAIESAGWAAPGAWVAIETERREPVDPGAMEVMAEREVARARLTLVRNPAPSPS